MLGVIMSVSSEREIDRCSFARQRIQPDSPAVPFDYLARNRQPCSGSTAEFFTTMQPFEDAKNGVIVFLRDADAVVPNVENDRALAVIEC